MKRKQIVTMTILLLVVLCLVGCGEKHEPSIHWSRDTTQKYLNDDSVRQIITVQATEGSEAVVMLFEKQTENGKTFWEKTLTCDGVIGLEGLGKTREGDNKTPIGDFGILTAFGIRENPGTSLPYIDVDENTCCCGDENFYNQIIDLSAHPHDCSNGEMLIEYSPEYNYGMFLDYNSECEVGKGSAIFFHCAGAKPYTGGCIAVEEENMRTILSALTDGARVIIDYMP